MLTQKLKDMVTKLYEKEFSVDELASALVNDVNRADGEMPHLTWKGWSIMDEGIN